MTATGQWSGRDEGEGEEDEETRKNIGQYFRSIGYAYVTLDLEGFRSGSMNEVLASKIKNQSASKAKPKAS